MLTDEIQPSPVTYRLMRVAKEAAAQRKHAKLGPIDLLQAIVSLKPEEDAVLNDALAELSIDRNEIIRQIREHIKSHQKTPSPSSGDGTKKSESGDAYSHETKSVLKHAEDIAVANGQVHYDPIHILYGLAFIPITKASGGILNLQVPLATIQQTCGELIGSQVLADQDASLDASREEAQSSQRPVFASAETIEDYLELFSSLTEKRRTPGLLALKNDFELILASR